MSLQARQTSEQRLMLAPNITLALEILRMPTLELRAFLERQLEENPLLELEEPENESNEQSEASEEPPKTDQSKDAPEEDPWSSVRSPDEQEEADEDGFERRLEGRLVVTETLQDSLLMQLGCQRISAKERQLGEILIRQLNDQGYLEGSMEELAAELKATPAELEGVLQIIQRLEPAGVGARNLQECLKLQLEYRKATASLAYAIVRDHFSLFVANRPQALAKALGKSLEEIKKACEELKQLDPKPGRIFSGQLPPSVIPDLIIRHKEKYYDVELNDQELPQISVNRAYYRMLKDPRTPEDAKEFLTGKFRRASWLIKAIDERNATLLSIARCLISLQRDFLSQGPQSLSPLTQAQVADLIGRHPSTVSRAIAGKTIDTPYGIFRLEQFFASAVPQATDGETISDARIKSEIQNLIGREDTYRPLSDSAIAKKLSQSNISVARRTIAKYRAELKILPAHLRRNRT